MLKKIILGEWERYLQYIKNCVSQCNEIQRIYTVSAGKFVKEVAKEFTKYLISNVSGIELVAEFSYRARRYKGMPNVPHYIAVFEFKAK